MPVDPVYTNEDLKKWFASPGQYQEQLSQYASGAMPTIIGKGKRLKTVIGPESMTAALKTLSNVDQTNPYSYKAQLLGSLAAGNSRGRRRASSIMSSSPETLASVTGSASGKTLLGQ